MTTLYETAVQIIREKNGNIAKATEPFVHSLITQNLIKDLAIDYLNRVAADIRAGERAQAQTPAADHARGKTGPNRRAKLPSKAQKAANIRNVVASALTFLDERKLRDGRAIGDVPLYELPRLAAGAAGKSVTFLSRGLEDAVDAIACHELSLLAQPTKADMTVRDAYKPAVVEEIYAHAKIKAAQRIADASARTARELLAGSPPAAIA